MDLEPNLSGAIEVRGVPGCFGHIDQHGTYVADGIA